MRESRAKTINLGKGIYALGAKFTSRPMEEDGKYAEVQIRIRN